MFREGETTPPQNSQQKQAAQRAITISPWQQGLKTSWKM
jgi:hypothetical protein